MTAKNLFTDKLSKILRSLSLEKKGSLLPSETQALGKREAATSYSLTTTLSAPLAGLPQSLRHLERDPIVVECRDLLSSLQNLDVIGTFSLSHSSSLYTISGFVEGTEAFLDISLSPELGPLELVMPPAITKEESIFWKLVIWLIVLMYFGLAVALMKVFVG